MNLMQGSPTWQAHKSALDSLMAQHGVYPTPQPVAPVQAAPAPAESPTAWWDYINAINARETGLGPTGANISPLGAWYGADGLRMPEFGMSGYDGGAPGSLAGLGGLGFNGSTVGGLLGALAGGIVGGPFGGLLGGIGGRAFGGWLGGDWGGSNDGGATSAVGGSAASQAAGYGGGYGTGPDGWGGL